MEWVYKKQFLGEMGWVHLHFFHKNYGPANEHAVHNNKCTSCGQFLPEQIRMLELLQDRLGAVSSQDVEDC